MDDIGPAFNPARKTGRRSRATWRWRRKWLDCCFKPFQLF